MEPNGLSETHFTDRKTEAWREEGFKELVTELGYKPRPFSQHRPPGVVQPSACFLSALLAIVQGHVMERGPAGMQLSGEPCAGRVV